MPTSQYSAIDRRRRHHVRWAFALPLSLLTLGGCSTVDRTKTSSIPMDDYRNRHPIVLAETEQKIDIFPAPESRGLDRRTAAQVEEFGALYRSAGSGPITVLVPLDPRGVPPRPAVEMIRRALAAGGAPAPLRVSSYPVVNSTLASPIRLSFVGLKSKVADTCGQWPSDLASGSSIQGWQNKPYWNFGCSYQSMFAEQVADPRDLVGPRADEPTDTEMRARAIEVVRKGTDPTTDWKTKNSAISTVGTN